MRDFFPSTRVCALSFLCFESRVLYSFFLHTKMDEFDDIVFDDYEFDTEITPQPTHTQLNQGSFGNELSFDDTQADNGPTKVKTRKFDEAL